MRIAYFYQFFTTSKGSWGTRVYDFTKKWVEHGHDVTVVTNRFAKSDITAEKFIETQNHEGIKVKVINVKLDNRQSSLKRIFTWFVYLIVACWYALTLRADVVIASSGPITVGITGLVAKYFRRRKFIFEVRDIWPQGAIEMGLLKNKYLINIAYWLEKRCYMAASYIVALSPGMVDDILKRYPARKAISITNAANIPLFSTLSGFDIGSYKQKKYAIYTGNIGQVNNSEWLYETAKILHQKNRDDIHILMIGEGQMRQKLEKLSSQECLPTIVFMPLMPKEKLVAYIQHAIVSLVPLKGTPILDSSSPNKFFESLAAGIPVIQTTQGWMKDFLEENQVGFTISPNDAEALAILLIKIADREIDISAMGSNAKKIAGQQFDKDYLANKMLSIVTEVYNSK
jgi:glycosyltransferase involved in cell wall biosynthesis